MMRLFIVLLSAFTALLAHAEPDYTCWGDPVNVAVVDIRVTNFSSNRKGTTKKMQYMTNPASFPGRCNSIGGKYFGTMAHYVDIGPTLIYSSINPGYFKLSDDVDIRIGTPGYYTSQLLYFPIIPSDGLLGTVIPPMQAENAFVSGFSVAGSGSVELKLRRDIIGGAIVVPSDTELFSAYRVANMTPFPPRPSRPLVQGRTKAGGQVIPIAPECSINQGNTIEVNFDTMNTNLISSSSSSAMGYRKDIALHFSCNTSLTQDIRVQLIADSAQFSSELIRSDNIRLGFALKHNGKIVKPMESFDSRLLDGGGNDSITLMPVKDPVNTLSGGEFNASATLVISSI
ncbi:fimbrial protein [Serratia rhizosphaerae]